MTPKELLNHELEELEGEYRFWLVEAIRMGRSIETMEDEIQQYDYELGPERVTDLRRRLTRIRAQHDDIEGRIRGVRRRLDDLRGRVEGLP